LCALFVQSGDEQAFVKITTLLAASRCGTGSGVAGAPFSPERVARAVAVRTRRVRLPGIVVMHFTVTARLSARRFAYQHA